MWFTSIIGLLTGLGGPIINLGSQLVDLQKQKTDAKTQVEKANINAQIEEIHDRRAVLVAEAGSRLASGFNAVTRTVAAIPAIAVIFKLMLWDKVIGSLSGCAGYLGKSDHCATFRTDTLDPYQWAVITAVIGFYFLASKMK